MLRLPIMTLAIALAASIGITPGYAQDEAVQKAVPEAAAQESAVQDETKPEADVAEKVKRECHLFGVTWDGGSKRGAVARAQSRPQEHRRRLARQTGTQIRLAL